MNAGLDTSVTLRLLIGEPADQAEAARRFLVASTNVAISDLVVGETYFALRHHYGVPHAEALRQLQALLDDRHVIASGAARAAIGDALAAGSRRSSPGFMDRLIRAHYANDALAVVTFDRDFATLANVNLLRAATE